MKESKTDYEIIKYNTDKQQKQNELYNFIALNNNNGAMGNQKENEYIFGKK